MNGPADGWFGLRAHVEEFLRDLAEYSRCATVDLDHLDGNLYYLRLGRAARRVEEALIADAVDRSALSFVALHRDLASDQPIGPDSSSLPDYVLSSARKIERDLLSVAARPLLPAEAAGPFDELASSLSEAMEEVGYTERDRETGEADSVHAIDPAECFGVGWRLSRLAEYLSDKDYGGASRFAEGHFTTWLDTNCPQYLKRADAALRDFTLDISELSEEDDAL